MPGHNPFVGGGASADFYDYSDDGAIVDSSMPSSIAGTLSGGKGGVGVTGGVSLTFGSLVAVALVLLIFTHRQGFRGIFAS